MSFFGHFSSGQATSFGNWLTRKTIEQQYRFVRRHYQLDENSAILEIGPGRGEFIARFIAAGFGNCDIIEPDDTLRKHCEQMPLRRIYHEILPPIVAPNSTYDLVIMCDVFEHMNDTPTALAVLKEIRRILKPNGCFFVLCPDYNHWKEDFFNCDYSHSNPTTARRMNQMLHNLEMSPIATSYHYTFLTGPFGWLIGNLIKLLTTPFKGEQIDSRFYSLRACFLRRFLTISVKNGE